MNKPPPVNIFHLKEKRSPEEQKIINEFKQLPRDLQIAERIEIRLARILDIVTRILNIAEKESIEMEAKAKAKTQTSKESKPHKP